MEVEEHGHGKVRGHTGPRKRRPKNKNKKNLNEEEDMTFQNISCSSPTRMKCDGYGKPTCMTNTPTKLCASATPFSPIVHGSSPNRSLEAANRAYWTTWAIEAAEQERTRRLQLLAEIQLDEDLERKRRQEWARQAIESEQHSRTTRMFLDAMQNTAWFQATISPSFLDYEVVCPHSWFGCTYSCMLRHLEEHLLECPYRQVPDTPCIEDLDLNSYDLVCPNAILGCKTICSRDTLSAHLTVCGGIRSQESEWAERLQSQQSVIAASETERIRRINELKTTSSEVHRLYDAQTKELQSRLHAEVAAFGAAHMTSANLRRPIISRVLEVISNIIQSTWPHASVEPYGSFVTQLNLPSSDVDLVIGPFHCDPVTPTGDIQTLTSLFESSPLLAECDIRFDSIRALAHASIPLLKVVAIVGEEVSVALDITLWTPQHQGLASAALGLQLCQDIPGLTELTLILKYYLAKRGMNDVYCGGLSSYGLLLMVTHVLLEQRKHNVTVLSSSLPESGDTLATSQRFKGIKIAKDLTKCVDLSGPLNLGKLLMDVLYYYGNDFQPEVDAISVNPGTTVTWSEPRPHLIIQDPLDSSNNVGRHCYRISHILRRFQDVSSFLTSLIVRENEGQNDSILDRIFESSE